MPALSIKDKRDFIIYRSEHSYSGFPTILKLSEKELLIVFNEGMRRIQVTHSDPSWMTMTLRSTDGGETWGTHPIPIGGYGSWGMENPGAVRLRNGMIIVQQYRPEYFTKEEMKKRYSAKGQWDYAAGQRVFPWHQKIHGNYNYIYRSEDGGRTWSDPIWWDASPYRMAFMLRAAVELPNGHLIMPCADDSFDRGAVFVAKSEDQGNTWSWLSTIADQPKFLFTEHALARLPSGKIIAMIRAQQAGEGYLYQSESLDDGKIWSRPKRTAMWGFPPHLLLLRDGSLLCVRGHRREPYGVRATLSHDGGESWNVENDLALREDFPNANLGYPTSTQFEDGRILTVYYGEDRGVTCIHGSFYRL